LKICKKGDRILQRAAAFCDYYPQEPGDPRELPEIPGAAVVYLSDSRYPWLPFLLDWKVGNLPYTAMLVPHQFSSKEGIQYNPALRFFLMQKLFVLTDWMQQLNT